MEDLVSKLKDIGFNTYEAKVYIELLKHNPSTGYEISKHSGVPQSRVYDTLKVLESRNVVVQNSDKPVKYFPVDPREILNNLEKTYISSLDFLRNELTQLAEETIIPVLNLKGARDIMDRAKELIDAAQREIFLEIWDQDAKILKKNLQEAYAREVDIKIVGYENVSLDCGLIYQHGLGDSIKKIIGGRSLIMSIDGRDGLVATISENETSSQAILTQNAGIVLIIKQLITHDLYLLDVESSLGDKMREVYGENLIKLRDKILGHRY